MKCPVCKSVSLVMSDRKGVEIDYCPDCRGVWLDRGELDKIIERSNAINQQNISPIQNQQTENNLNQIKETSHQKHADLKHNKRNKKNSKVNRMGDLLGDLFDF